MFWLPSSRFLCEVDMTALLWFFSEVLGLNYAAVVYFKWIEN